MVENRPGNEWSVNVKRGRLEMVVNVIIMDSNGSNSDSDNGVKGDVSVLKSDDTG